LDEAMGNCLDVLYQEGDSIGLAVFLLEAAWSLA